MENKKRTFTKCFGSGESKIEIDLREIPMDLLLEEVNSRLGNKLEVQGLALLVERLGLEPEAIDTIYFEKKKQRENN